MAGLRGAGKVYLDVLRDGSYSGWMDMANIASLTLGNDGGDTTTLKSTAPANYGAVIGSATTPGDDTISIALNVPNRKNLTTMFLGSDTSVSVTGSTVTGEAHTVNALGTYVLLAHRKISAVTVSNQDGNDATTFATSTAVTAGAYVVPTTANTYFYKVTTAGTTGVAEPTWGTTVGGTTTSGTATFTNMGKIVLVEDTNFSVDTDNGLINVISGVEAGRAIEVDYTYGSITGYKIDARTVSSINCKMLFVGENLDNNDNIRVVANSVELTPEGDFNLISADGEFLEFTLSGTIKVPDGETVPFTMEVTS